MGPIPVLTYSAYGSGCETVALPVVRLVRRVKIFAGGPIEPLAVPAAAYGKGAPQRSNRERDPHPAARDGLHGNCVFGRDADRDASAGTARELSPTTNWRRMGC